MLKMARSANEADGSRAGASGSGSGGGSKRRSSTGNGPGRPRKSVSGKRIPGAPADAGSSLVIPFDIRESMLRLTSANILMFRTSQEETVSARDGGFT